MDALIARHGLVPHPEGGWYRETYRAARTLPGTDRCVCTAILYLLGAGQRSRLHRIDSDELWHFHGGDPLRLVRLIPDAPAQVDVLSTDQPQLVVPAFLVRGDAGARVPVDAQRVYRLSGIRVRPFRGR